MFYLWHEEYDTKHPKFRVVKFQKDVGLQQYARYETLSEVINQSFSYPHYHHYFLLDDSRFHFFRFDIYREVDTPFSIDEFNVIVQERLQYLKNQTKEELLFTNVDSIYVDGEPKKFLLGAKGQIFFRLYLVYINRNTLLEFNKTYGNLFHHKQLHIFPESFKTIAFLKRRLERDAFLLLYIKENSCKVIAIQD